MTQPVTKPEDEPSMEEILASIRKIISDDDVKEAEQGVKAAEAEVQPQSVSEDDDVLELTEMVDESGNPIQGEMTAESPETVEEVKMSDPQEIILDEEVETEAETAASEVQVEDVTPDETYSESYEEEIEPSEPLISGNALNEAAAALGGLNQVANKAPRSSEPQMEGPFVQKTAEELVKDILKPLLKEWLDANLPSLVKWIVAEQVEKIVQQSSGYQSNVKDE